MRAVDVRKWFDLGHLDKYYEAKKRFTGSRFFNTLKHDEILGTVTKYSEDGEKLKNEIQWYLKIPERLQVLTPKIIDHSLKTGEGKKVFIELEYYGYPPLSELWVYGQSSKKVWHTIIDRIVHIVSLFMHYPGQIDIGDYSNIYVRKVESRISSARIESKVLDTLFSNSTVIINGVEYAGWETLNKFGGRYWENLYNVADNCIIHGDLCFSNILFDLMNGIVRLIDPRGRWGTQDVYGDIKYDLAKLRHSISGLYDFIMGDLFNLSSQGNTIRLEFPQVNGIHRDVAEYFDERIGEKWDIGYIKFIEGQLFLSMLPLHSDNEKRQVAMFARGIMALNEVYREKGAHTR
jgi:hypothetical protein